ncbi:MAG: peptide-methionine (S)-S-oxide reductase MsrA [Gammaproteobacteria bacterium]|nr:peptide-methionine (S)-S-oxide reductase MsrA [Gammaproteobacteria bacterium]
MKTIDLSFIVGLVVLLALAPGITAAETSKPLANAIFAGGCFWCIEADFEKLDGVKEVRSGYTGGSAATASYKQVVKNNTGHYEAVIVHFDPDSVSYAELVEYFWRHIDPTDAEGQFCDKGESYRTAIFYGSEQQQIVAQASLDRLKQNKPFDAPIVTPLIPAQPFYDAETYHQDYYKKNPIRYNYYRRGCGRDKRVEELWGE